MTGGGAGWGRRSLSDQPPPTRHYFVTGSVVSDRATTMDHQTTIGPGPLQTILETRGQGRPGGAGAGRSGSGAGLESGTGVGENQDGNG